MDKATPDSAPANVEGVMAIAFELARIREEHGAQSGMYLSEVRALRAEVERLAAQSAPTDDAMWDQTLQERDTYHDWADKLAEGIAAHLGVDIGEHTAGAGANNPWANALEAIQAVAQSAPLAQQARKYPPLPKGHEWPDGAGDWYTQSHLRAYVDADRAAAQVEQSMPSSEWLAEFSSLLTNIENARWSEGSASANFDKLGEKNYEAEAVETRAALLAHLSKRVTAQVEPVRMLTQVELTAALDLTDTFDAIQANAIRAFCRVNAGKRIPADGEVRS